MTMSRDSRGLSAAFSSLLSCVTDVVSSPLFFLALFALHEAMKIIFFLCILLHATYVYLVVENLLSFTWRHKKKREEEQANTFFFAFATFADSAYLLAA